MAAAVLLRWKEEVLTSWGLNRERARCGAVGVHELSAAVRVSIGSFLPKKIRVNMIY